MLLLASASPRRAELVRWLGVPVVVRPARVDEAPRPGEDPEAYVRRVALAKARAVEEVPPGWWVLAADTAVVLEGRILGKPRDPQEATAMLRALRGRDHTVLTAFALREPRQGREHVRVVATRVVMRSYSNEEIAAYVASGLPLDKAGAYGIQDVPFRPVARLEPVACFANVVGLPVCHVYRTLQACLPLPQVDIAQRCRKAWDYVCSVSERIEGNRG